jgi:hypothetical protein
VFRNVDDGVGVKEKFGGERADIDPGLAQCECEGEVIRRIGFLEIGLGERITNEIQSFRGVICGKKHGGGVKLESVIGPFFGEHAADAGDALRPGCLNQFPKGIQFLVLGSNLTFIELGKVEAVRLGLFRTKGITD